MSDFKVIKVDRFYSKAVKDGFDDIVRQIFNNRVKKPIKMTIFIFLKGWRKGGLPLLWPAASDLNDCRAFQRLWMRLWLLRSVPKLEIRPCYMFNHVFHSNRSHAALPVWFCLNCREYFVILLGGMLKRTSFSCSMKKSTRKNWNGRSLRLSENTTTFTRLNSKRLMIRALSKVRSAKWNHFQQKLEYKAEKCCSTFMDVNGQVLVQFLEEWIMKCRSEVKPEKKSN